MRIICVVIIVFGFLLTSCCQKALHFDPAAYSTDIQIRKKAFELIKKSINDDYSIHEPEINGLKKQIEDAYDYETKRGVKCNCVSLGMLATLKNNKGGLYTFFDDWKAKGKMNPIVVQLAEPRLDSAIISLPQIEDLKIKK